MSAKVAMRSAVMRLTIGNKSSAERATLSELLRLRLMESSTSCIMRDSSRSLERGVVLSNMWERQLIASCKGT